jgi:hypothetical protein
MRPRIERRRAQVGRWLLYPLIALSAAALAKLATAAPPTGSPTVYRVIPLSSSDISSITNARGQLRSAKASAAASTLPSTMAARCRGS